MHLFMGDETKPRVHYCSLSWKSFDLLPFAPTLYHGCREKEEENKDGR